MLPSSIPYSKKFMSRMINDHVECNGFDWFVETGKFEYALWYVSVTTPENDIGQSKSTPFSSLLMS